MEELARRGVERHYTRVELEDDFALVRGVPCTPIVSGRFIRLPR